MHTTAVRRRRPIAILAGFLLVVGVAVAGLANPPAALASTCPQLVFDNTSQIELLHTNCAVSILADSTTATYQQSAVSPDGSAVAFASLQNTNGSGGNDYPANGIYTMSIGGTNERQLTFPEPCQSGCDQFNDYAPSWNNNGTKLVFQRFGVVTGDSHYTAKIMVVNADGSGLTTLVSVTNGNSVGSPVFSPDGTKIAYMYCASACDIYEMNADGSNQHEVNSADQGGAGAPAWSPDGTKLYFTDTINGTPGIYVMNANGTGKPSVVISDSFAQEPSVASNGTLYYVDNVSGKGYELYSANATGGNQQLTILNRGGYRRV